MKPTKLFFTVLAVLFISWLSEAQAGKIAGTVKAKGLRTPSDILVYLAKGPELSVDLSQAKFVMDQQNLTFIPHVLPVPVGATVYFPNNDQVDHNVFSLSRTKKFNLGSYKPGQAQSVVFDKPGIVELRCDVHAEMSAFILVLKNPFWSVTDDKGRFEIPAINQLKHTNIKGVTQLPPGEYVIKTWHAKLKNKKTKVVVDADGNAFVELVLTRGTPGVLYK